MKIFAVYFEKSGDDYRHPLGDRSVVILDGRKTLGNQIADAMSENGHCRPKYDAFAIYKGTFLKPIPVTDLMDCKTCSVIRKITAEDF